VCGVDVQDDRLEGEVKAYGHGRESWGVDYFIIPGDPSSATLWADLDRKLQSEYRHESGVNMRIACTCIDSGGHYTDEVYAFCSGKEYRRIWAIKGSNQTAQPIITRPSKSKKGNLLYFIGTDTAKEMIYAWLSKKEIGPGYMHFPNISSYDMEYFAQLTVEVPVTKYKRGYPYIVWEKREGQRNEALDINVYALAAQEILNPDYRALEANLKKQTKSADEVKEQPIKRQTNNWVYGWKK
jgi:phage terminase large subunit GpA-like protein